MPTEKDQQARDAELREQVRRELQRKRYGENRLRDNWAIYDQAPQADLGLVGKLPNRTQS